MHYYLFIITYLFFLSKIVPIILVALGILLIVHTKSAKKTCTRKNPPHLYILHILNQTKSKLNIEN
jgi:hypothetical protein